MNEDAAADVNGTTTIIKYLVMKWQEEAILSAKWKLHKKATLSKGI